MDNTTNKGRVVLHTTLFNQQAPGDLSQSLLMNAYYKSETVVDEAFIKKRYDWCSIRIIFEKTGIK